ncbi:MAG: hypothetical protein P1U89_23570 [Verrucomicrobiales bacterium]|nr:hypothetical protein [Verrucomicrobiales bacterium]
MNPSPKTIYLSAVEWEFESYKDELAHALTRRGFLVKSREDFVGGRDRLEQIEAFIRQSDIVICLVGDQFGEEPDSAQAAEFADISKGRHSFAQWEFFFGTHVAKSIHVFYPAANTPPDNRNDEDDNLKQLQIDFRKTWVETGNVAALEFSDYSSLCEEALVIPSLNPSATEPVIARALNLDNPYVGLRSFSEADTDRFFGRKALTDEIISKVKVSPVLTLFGRSGSGKTSVVNAGVIPIFRKQNPTSKVAVFSPGKHPFKSMARAFEKQGFPDDLVALAGVPSSRKFQELLKHLGNAKEPALIFIDQFEEIFTRPEKHEAPVIFQFVQSLIDISQIPNSPVRLILGLRGDFMGRLSEFRGLPAALDQNLVRVTPPTWEEFCEMVEIPAANHGVRFEPNLVARIVSHVEGKPQRLPFLQFALELLWEVEKADQGQFGVGVVVDDDFEKMGGLHDRRINRVSYQKISGVEGALPAKMESVYGKRNPGELRRIRNLLLSFISITETDLGLTPVSRSESLANLKKACGIGSRALIEEMLKEKLLVESASSTNTDPVYEIAHEALILAWSHFENWVGEIREAAQMKRALSVAAAKWEEKRSKGEKIGHLDLWGGAKLQRAHEFNTKVNGSALSDFARVGGLNDTELDFLTASSDRYVKESHHQLSESAAKWKKEKSKDLLWSGAQLNRALELNEVQPGAEQSEFGRIGGLGKTEEKFLQHSEKNRQPSKKGMGVALALTSCVAILAIFTPLGGLSEQAQNASMGGIEKVKGLIEKYLPADNAAD